MAIKLIDFLKAHQFKAHPFLTTNAEQERLQLAEYFVRVGWFDQVVGDTRQPESLILFAPRGYGKTSHRLEVARLSGERSTAPALVVNFTDFDQLAAETAQPVDLNRYIEIIRAATLEALDDFLLRYPEREHDFAPNQAVFMRFCALLYLYAPFRALDRNITFASVERYIQALQQINMGSKAWLQELSRLARLSGCASVYLLIDGIDELLVTSSAHHPDRALNLLYPLLSAPGLLQECGFAFKFFLPNFLEAPMRQQHIARLDRIPVYRLEWSETDLRTMLSRRLTSYSLLQATSHTGYVNAFQDLCDTDSDVDSRLVQAAGSSPRILIDLARQLIEQHCRVATSIEELIKEETITLVLGKYANNLLPEHTATVPVQPDTATVQAVRDWPSTSPTDTGTTPLLFFDERGDVWIGNHRCNNKPLPKHLRRCMAYLWQNRYRTVTYAELEQELYGETLEKRGDPRSSLDKLIRRLREVLEPGKPGSHTYIATQPGTGYVVNNYRDP